MGRHSVGTAVVGGMLLSTILNLFFIPILYVLLKTLLGRSSKKKDLPGQPPVAVG
jgi:HAE1 family hydrophobic/amphiphilic exporter-1